MNTNNIFQNNNPTKKEPTDKEFWLLLALTSGICTYLNKDLGVHYFWSMVLLRITVYGYYGIKLKIEYGEGLTKFVGKIFIIGMIYSGLMLVQGFSIR